MDLRSAALNVTSQCGEDGILEAIFEVLGVSRGACVEFGAWDGKKHSNTWSLISRGWYGVLIEGNRDRYTDLVMNYPARGGIDLDCMNRVVGFDPPNTLDEILNETSIPLDFDLLSIDIDGNDYHVFAAMKMYRPKVVVIEFNPSIPNDFRFVQARDMRCNQGSSLLALTELARSKDYKLIATTAVNAIYVREELFPRFEIPDNSLAALHPDVGLQTYIIQLYDGTIMLAGYGDLIWHEGIRITIPQVLPTHQRKFPDALEKDLEGVPFKPLMCNRVGYEEDQK